MTEQHSKQKQREQAQKGTNLHSARPLSDTLFPIGCQRGRCREQELTLKFSFLQEARDNNMLQFVLGKKTSKTPAASEGLACHSGL